MSTSNDVLDAARTCLLRGGSRKLTLSEVAREAGVSRPTVYRRWPEVSSVIRDLLTREMARIVAEHRVEIDVEAHAARYRRVAAGSSVGVLDRAGSDHGIPIETAIAMRGAVIETSVEVASAVGRNAVFVSLGTHQPEVIAPYIFSRLGTSQRNVLALLANRIVEVQRHGGIRPGRPDHLAAMVLLMVQSAVQSRTMMEPILGSDWDTELRIALEGYLAPHPEPTHPERSTGDRS